MESLFIPTHSFWLNGNTWYGSLGDTRFYIEPLPPQGDTDGWSLSAKVWKGPLTLALSQVLEEATFSLGREGEGLDELTVWLEQQTHAINQGEGA